MSILEHEKNEVKYKVKIAQTYIRSSTNNDFPYHFPT